MISATPSPATQPPAPVDAFAQTSLTRTARTTGLWYLGIVVTGIVSFAIIRGNLFVDGDSAATALNLMENTTQARIGIAMDLGLVITQAVTALWFYRLFRHIDSFAAAAVAALGMANAVAHLVATVFSATALNAAIDGNAAADVQLLYELSDATWAALGIFSGLWLIPMGRLVLKSRTMPRALGFLLVGGGFGYILATFTGFIFPDVASVGDALTWVAAVGEFWIIGYLLTVGLRQHTAAGTSSA